MESASIVERIQEVVALRLLQFAGIVLDTASPLLDAGFPIICAIFCALRDPIAHQTPLYPLNPPLSPA